MNGHAINASLPYPEIAGGAVVSYSTESTGISWISFNEVKFAVIARSSQDVVRVLKISGLSEQL